MGTSSCLTGWSKLEEKRERDWDASNYDKVSGSGVKVLHLTSNEGQVGTGKSLQAQATAWRSFPLEASVLVSEQFGFGYRYSVSHLTKKNQQKKLKRMSWIFRFLVADVEGGACRWFSYSVWHSCGSECVVSGVSWSFWVSGGIGHLKCCRWFFV